jgi:hypothetical protein
MIFNFYLGIHVPVWLNRLDVPMFLSRRRLVNYKRLPIATARWALDSGGFTEVHRGGWGLSASEYAGEVRRYADEIGKLDWAAPQDWMCESTALQATGLTVLDHQERTTANFLDLRQELGTLVIPVLQGWSRDDYLRHVDAYEAAGVALADENRIGVGSICRRYADNDIGAVLGSLQPLRLHAFGVKGTALAKYYDWMASADSMAWSATARWGQRRLPGCTHKMKNCGECSEWALRWREKTLRSLHQQRLFTPV